MNEYGFLDDIFFELEKYVPDKTEREVVILHFKGYSLSEVSRKLDINEYRTRKIFSNFITTVKNAMQQDVAK